MPARVLIPSEVLNLRRILWAGRPRYANLFVNAAEAARGQIVLHQLEDAIVRYVQASGPERIVAELQVDTLVGRLRVDLIPFLESLMIRAGRSAMPAFEETFGIPPISLPVFKDWAETAARAAIGKLITAITAQQRASVVDVVHQAFVDGDSPSMIAKTLRGVVGLDRVRAGAFDKWIGEASAPDGAFADLSEAQIQRAIDGEYLRLLKSRTLTISRTETANAARDSQRQIWKQAIDENRLSARRYVREIVRPPRADPNCPICGPFAGLEAPIGVDYPNGAGAGPPFHPNCECAERLRLARA